MIAGLVLASLGDTVATWMTAVGTIAASVLALAFGLGARDWWQRPRVRLEFDPAADADRVTVPTVGGQPAAYARLRAVNDGRSAARRIQVAVTGVSTWTHPPGHWLGGKFDLHGRALVWSNSPEQATAVGIPPKGARYLDLISIVRDLENQGFMEMTLEIGQPMPAGRSERLSPGSWQFALEVSGDNIPAFTRYVAVTFNGLWPADPPDRVWNQIAVAPPSAKPHKKPSQPATPTIEEQLEQAADGDAE